jgi:hypothetical protein
MRDFCINGNIIHHLTAVGLPRRNGQVERYHKTLLSSLATMGANTNDDQWDENIINIQLGLNGTVNATIGVTPSEALMGFRVKENPVLDNGLPDVVDVTRVREEISQRIAKHQAEQKRHFDSKRMEAPTYDIGDLVITTVIANPPSGHSQKLLPKWRGPSRVTQVLGRDRYEISNIPGSVRSRTQYRRVVGVECMKPWITYGME